MKKEFNLSEKICKAYWGNEVMLEVEDVREFIKRLKEHFNDAHIDRVIDKLAGEKLNGK